MDVLIYLILFFMGRDCSKPPSPEVPKLIKQLGDDEWKVRENAQRKLEKMGPEIHTALEETINKDKDLERRRRCERILPKVMNVYSDDKDNWCPSIYYLPNTIRFPKGYDYTPQNYTDGTQPKFETEMDVAKVYFAKARKIHNKRYGNKLGNKDWRDDWVEKDAMQLFVRDLRIKGIPEKVCRKMLNWSVDMTKNYSLPYSHDDVPGPATMHGNNYGYYNGCYQYRPLYPDGNWKQPHTILKWKWGISAWPTAEDGLNYIQNVWEKYFPPEPNPMYRGHPGPTND
jgi:hypothetical protein